MLFRVLMRYVSIHNPGGLNQAPLLRVRYPCCRARQYGAKHQRSARRMDSAYFTEASTSSKINGKASLAENWNHTRCTMKRRKKETVGSSCNMIVYLHTARCAYGSAYTRLRRRDWARCKARSRHRRCVLGWMDGWIATPGTPGTLLL